MWGSDDDTDIEYMYQELLYDTNEIILRDVRDQKDFKNGFSNAVS